MEISDFLVLSILKTLTLILGGIFLYYTWRAYRRTRLTSILSLFFAIGLMTVGVLVEGVTIQVIGMDPVRAHELEAAFHLAGFAVLVYSLFSHRMRHSVTVARVEGADLQDEDADDN